jgi:surface antigen
MSEGRAMGRRLARAAAMLVAAQLAGAALAAERQGLLTGDGEGSAGEAQPVREYRDAAGRLCRVYARRIVIDGETRIALATVCRDANGRWVLSR